MLTSYLTKKKNNFSVYFHFLSKKMENVNIEDLDLYELLEIDITSTVADIKKAYRRKALECHPDKNPDDPSAATKFHQLAKILEILTDEAARSAYDKVLNGKKEAALRHKKLDGKRRKLKEDLEARERKAFEKSKEKSADQLLREEIERLRKEGSKEVEEEVAYVQQKLKEELMSEYCNGSQHRIKVKWSANKNDSSNGGYTKDMLHRFLSKYGDIQAIVMSSKKNGSALVEFKDKMSAEMAVNLEIGLSTNPLKLEWIDDAPKSNRPTSNLIKETDFESVTLTKMRQFEERKRIIAQMMEEDKEAYKDDSKN